MRQRPPPREALAGRTVEELAHVAAWRGAYRAFGAKPQRTRNSLEALLRRAASGLPRVNRLTDLYNAISVLHQVRLGGEDLTRYTGAPRLIRASGEEPSTPSPAASGHRASRSWRGRVVRQGRGDLPAVELAPGRPRTQLREDTTTALFILDALDPMTSGALHATADDLVARLTRLGPDIRAARGLITAGTRAEDD